MYWENLQKHQEGASASDFMTYAEPQTSIAETALPALKDVWPVQQNTQKCRKAAFQADRVSSPATTITPTLYDPCTVTASVPATYTTPNVYEGDNSEAVTTIYVDERPVINTGNETEYEDPIKETHITEIELSSPDYIDYSRLGPSAKDLVLDGQALLDGFNAVLDQMHNTYEALKAENKENAGSPTSDVCQVQIDGLPLSQLFQSFLPHLQNEGGQKMLEQYQQLSAQLSHHKCMSFLQTMQQQQRHGNFDNSQAVLGQSKSIEKVREEASLLDLHETAETLINFAKYPVEKKAVVVEMIPQTSEVIPGPDQNFICPQSVSSNTSSGYCTASPMESLPMDHFEFTKEDKELMQECATPVTPEETESIEKLINETFENVEKTKFISDEVAAAIPDIQRKFLVRIT